jgi:RNA recognition motif-containing protein
MKGGEVLPATLYVGNLAWDVTEDDLAQAFGTCAKVCDARVIAERHTGRSRGFGFVDVEERDVEQVLRVMNEYELKGRKILVNQAQSRRGEGRR